MKKSNKATSIAEALVVLLIIVVGLTGVYNIFSQSIKLTDSVENKIQAIQIAREGIEAITNIRDTNWILFSSDLNNCWKTLNYNSSCVGNNSHTINIGNNISYRIIRDSDNRWLLTQGTTGSYSNTTYRNFYKVFLDNKGLYTHGSGGNLKHTYTREIITNNIDPGDGNSNNGLRVRSIVRWVDSSGSNGSKVHEVILETILTNHKK